MSKGQFGFIADVFPNGTTSGNRIEFTSAEDTIPFGITYAVFGDDSVSPAKYAFRDGKRILFKRIFILSANVSKLIRVDEKKRKIHTFLTL